MRGTPTMAPILVGVLLLSLVASAGGATAGAGGASAVASGETAATAVGPQLEQCAVESGENFTAPTGGDAIGYVDGYWYDEPIVVPADDGGSGDNATDTNGTRTPNGTQQSNGTDDGNATAKPGNASTQFNASDGLSDPELSALVTRTAARVEALRCLSFASVPPVRIVNRSTVRANQLEAISNRSAAARRFDDARLSTALLLGGDANASEARAETTAAATLGYYDSIEDEIVIVAEDGEVAALDEPTLAHELVHALQDQQFDLRRFDAATTDAAFAEAGLIEGDASLVGHRYRTRCEDGDWATGCLRPTNAPTTGNSEYLGLELLRFLPYNSGPAYVESLYDRGGWAAVDERYDDPPTSTKQLLYPSTPRDFESANVTMGPVNDSAWTRVVPASHPGYDVLGPGTIGAAMLAPTFDAGTENVYDDDTVTNDGVSASLDPLHPYNYAVDATAGWRGGRLEVYRDDANRTATRWRTEWESETAAATFRDRYVQLLDVRGSQRSDEFVGTYYFPAGSSYDGHYAVRRNGTSVVIVHGPDLAALRALDDRAVREHPPPAPSSTSRFDASKRAAEDVLSGPGAVGAVLGIVVAVGTAAAIVVRRRS